MHRSFGPHPFLLLALIVIGVVSVVLGFKFHNGYVFAGGLVLAVGSFVVFTHDPHQ